MTDGTTFLRLMERSICESISHVRSFEHFQNLAETDFVSTIAHELSGKSCAISPISVRLSAFLVVHWLLPGRKPGVTDAEHVQKPCCDRFCSYDRLRPLRPVARCFCD